MRADRADQQHTLVAARRLGPELQRGGDLALADSG
jgi:hypothetical protein